MVQFVLTPRVEHVESCGTADLKAAKRIHKRGHRIADYGVPGRRRAKAAGFTYQVVNEKTGRRELGRRMHDL